MSPDAYIEMAQIEDEHWWFTGRRVILRKILSSLSLQKTDQILEVGCGTGGNLEMLSDYGSVKGFDMDKTALSFAQKKTNDLMPLRQGSCPGDLPFQDKQFDLICMFDVLEHIEQDEETLSALSELLNDNGKILITVPANQWLFGGHDEFLHHKRRYSKKGLKTVIENAGLQCRSISHFNSFLFPIACAVRLGQKIMGKKNTATTELPGPVLNSVFHSIFASEAAIVPKFGFPFGLSLYCVISRPDS